MTDPAGTVRLDAVVIVPTVRPAAVSTPDASAIPFDASECARFTTSGTVTCGRPDETTRATVVLMTTSAPAAGFWLMTDPAGTVRLDAVVTVPTVSVAAVIALDAAAC